MAEEDADDRATSAAWLDEETTDQSIAGRSAIVTVALRALGMRGVTATTLYLSDARI